MIRADLNQMPCGSSNRRNRDILSCVLVCFFFLFGCVTVRLCGSELVSVRLLMVFCADLATSLCGQLYLNFQFWGVIFSMF